jgi:hypothetical protein
MTVSKGILPEGESLRRALKWLSEKRTESPDAPRGQLIDEAALRFDLSPNEVEYLLASWK